jgi:drug/metabolite transporter (DMT)-like permease
VSHALLGFLAATASGLLYAAATTLQAMESRRAPTEHRLRASLLGFLLRRPRWVLGTFLGLLGWPLQAVALALAPVALVQPTLASGLLAIVVVAHFALGEPVSRRSALAALAIVAGIGLLAIGLPASAAAHPHRVLLAVALAVLAVLAAVPLRLRGLAQDRPMALAFAAGSAYVWVALATTLLDRALGSRSWLVALAWLAGIGLAAGVAGVTEMSAFGVARASRVAPVIFACEMVAPALLAPLVGQHLGLHGSALVVDVAALLLVAAGVTELSRTPAVAQLATGHG